MAVQRISSYQTDAFRRLAEPLDGILGAKTAKPLAALGLRTVADLMGHLPRRYLSGTQTSDLSTVEPGEGIAIVARVQHLSVKGAPPKQRLEAILTDGHGSLVATFFGKAHLIKWWQLQLSMGTRGIFVGKVGVFRDVLQMSHPDFVMIDDRGRIVGRANESQATMAKQVSTSGMIGIYPASSKIKTWQVAECANFVLDMLTDMPDPMPESLRADLRLPELVDAFTEIHRPTSQAGIDAAIERLKFDEALALQVVMAYRRADAARRQAPSIPLRSDGILADFDARLPYELTAGQREVSEQIFADLTQTTPMQRLLQGEVGSGKTVVALRSMLAAVDAGQQAVLLAPTEVLAAQHHESIREMLGDLGAGQVLGAPEHATDVVLLTGAMSTAQRKAALLKIASGEAGIVIGTHALLGDQVIFADLGLVVVDEQHRFGVEQRAALLDKGSDKAQCAPHLLVLTATPIPRSMAMTAFGDLEVSTLREIPAGRQEVQTTVVDVQQHPAWLDRAWQRIVEEVAAGRQAFVVCPRISSSDKELGEDAAASANVEDVYAQLSSGPLRELRVGMLHGRMSGDDKQQTMTSFVAGELDVLVATTVIEVGVNVPNASMMVILDADRFGISQLHQLRGRIGRGEHPGVCLLVTAAAADSTAADRLAAVASTRDGFELAELDLEQRREGDILGAQQSGGRSTLRLLRVSNDADLIAKARDVAAELVAADPEKQSAWLADMVTQVEELAAEEWLERS